MPPSQLQIQLKALERLIKEKNLYSRDAENESIRLQEMKAEMVDVYEIKKQEEVLRESIRMVPEIEAKIEIFKRKLTDLLANYEGDENLDVAKDLLNRC
ncbi:hypothetical protein JCM33374_g191 [Metschnikowia sp. JCM 33374]|nr:hypothetical protein JCM33374_g191 [Metschnikowia sp. JCM 33374]